MTWPGSWRKFCRDNTPHPQDRLRPGTIWPQMMEETDIFVSGGGIAGLVTAAAFGQAGFSVILADPAPPPESMEAEGSDLRSTAYLQPSRDLMDKAALWPALEAHAAPLEVLRVIDSVGWPPVERARRDFRADDLSDRPFGWNLPNWLTRKVLAETIAGLPGVRLCLGTGFSSMLAREAEALVTLTDGTRIRARLVVGADGRGSPVREAAGISVSRSGYGQKAFALAARHEQPHENISTEIYNRGGAFTLVPMPDVEGVPCSAVVWMNDGAEAVRLAALEDVPFDAHMTERSLGVLGKLTTIGPRRLWPIITQTADRLTARRTALVAEAAHVLPPIGAQGLNTSLQDVAALVTLAAGDPERLGEAAMLDAYARRRATDIHVRARVIDLFNRVCKSDAPPVQALRLAGLKAVHDIRPVRRAVMQAGLGRQAT